MGETQGHGRTQTVGFLERGGGVGELEGEERGRGAGERVKGIYSDAPGILSGDGAADCWGMVISRPGVDTCDRMAELATEVSRFKAEVTVAQVVA